jgi:haloalkane dehalogenase
MATHPPTVTATPADRDAQQLQAWDADRRFAATAAGGIAYVERGAGEAALFLHGFPLNSFQWRDVVARLETERRCIVPDLLGMGHTRVAPGQRLALPDQANMIVRLLDTLSVASVDVIANDSGTGIAQLLAARFPERVRTMLLTNGDVEIDSPPAALVPFIQMAKEGRFADEVVTPSVQNKEMSRSAEGIGGLTYTDPSRLSDVAIDAYFGPLVSSDARRRLLDAYASALEPNPLEGLEAALRGCEVPTRIVWGTGDVIFSPANPAYLDRLLPRSRGVREVPGAKLFFPEEYPELIAEEARALWDT